jgi:hypothetical protein
MTGFDPDRVKTRPSDKPFQIFGEFWPILSDCRLADRALPLWTSSFSGKIRVFTRSGPAEVRLGVLDDLLQQTFAALRLQIVFKGELNFPSIRHTVD